MEEDDEPSLLDTIAKVASESIDSRAMWLVRPIEEMLREHGVKDVRVVGLSTPAQLTLVVHAKRFQRWHPRCKSEHEPWCGDAEREPWETYQGRVLRATVLEMLPWIQSEGML